MCRRRPLSVRITSHTSAAASRPPPSSRLSPKSRQPREDEDEEVDTATTTSAASGEAGYRSLATPASEPAPRFDTLNHSQRYSLNEPIVTALFKALLPD